MILGLAVQAVFNILTLRFWWHKSSEFILPKAFFLYWDFSEEMWNVTRITK